MGVLRKEQPRAAKARSTMTSTLSHRSTLDDDRAALVDSIESLLTVKPDLLAANGTVAVLREMLTFIGEDGQKIEREVFQFPLLRQTLGVEGAAPLGVGPAGGADPDFAHGRVDSRFGRDRNNSGRRSGWGYYGRSNPVRRKRDPR